MSRSEWPPTTTPKVPLYKEAYMHKSLEEFMSIHGNGFEAVHALLAEGTELLESELFKDGDTLSSIEIVPAEEADGYLISIYTSLSDKEQEN